MGHEDETSNTDHLERDAHIRATLSETQKCKMITEMHTALIGKPFENPPKPGVLSKVDVHEKVLFGTDSYEGLVKSNKKITRLLWAGGGLVLGLQICWAVYSLMKLAPVVNK
jgi:hypothetical protein